MKTKVIRFRVTDAEYEQLGHYAIASGTSLTNLMRQQLGLQAGYGATYAKSGKRPRIDLPAPLSLT